MLSQLQINFLRLPFMCLPVKKKRTFVVFTLIPLTDCSKDCWQLLAELHAGFNPCILHKSYTNLEHCPSQIFYLY